MHCIWFIFSKVCAHSHALYPRNIFFFLLCLFHSLSYLVTGHFCSYRLPLVLSSDLLVSYNLGQVGEALTKALESNHAASEWKPKRTDKDKVIDSFWFSSLSLITLDMRTRGLRQVAQHIAWLAVQLLATKAWITKLLFLHCLKCPNTVFDLWSLKWSKMYLFVNA